MMRDYKKDNISLERAVEMILEHICPVADVERVPLLDGIGRVLAVDVRAPMDNPPFDRSPVDGYALRSADTAAASKEQPVYLKVAASVDAGGHFPGQVLSGQAVRIMTGAPIPEGCDACIRQESTDYGEETVAIHEPCAPFSNYCYAGEDFKKGQHMLTAGTKLGYVEIAVLASMGQVDVPVYRLPEVAVFATGDELVMPGTELGPGKIYNSNMFGLVARMMELGIRPIIFAQLPDDPAAAAQCISRAAGRCGLIITTGGVSVGKKDIIHDVIGLLGAQRLFWGVAIKPGMPTIFSMIGDAPMISLTGNPFGALTNFELLVRPALAKLCHDDTLVCRRSWAVMADGFLKQSPVRRFVRAMYENGTVRLPEGSHASGVLASMQGCDCLVDIPPGTRQLLPGTAVDIVLIKAAQSHGGTGHSLRALGHEYAGADGASGAVNWAGAVSRTGGPEEVRADADVVSSAGRRMGVPAALPPMFAVSGVKNSGKTTLIEGLLPEFSRRGLRVAVIKHDGHEFDGDVPGTDSHRHFKAGACGSAVYSQSRWMALCRNDGTQPEDLVALFPDADLILCEGLKNRAMPKLEIIRMDNSNTPVCPKAQVCFYVSDGSPEVDKPVYALDDIEGIASAIIESLNH